MVKYLLGIDIGSTTVKIVILGENNEILFYDYGDTLPIFKKH